MVTCYVPDATCDEEGEFYSNVELPPCLRSRLFLSNAVLWPVAQSNEVEGSEESLDFDLAASSVGLARIGETFALLGVKESDGVSITGDSSIHRYVIFLAAPVRHMDKI